MATLTLSSTVGPLKSQLKTQAHQFYASPRCLSFPSTLNPSSSSSSSSPLPLLRAARSPLRRSALIVSAQSNFFKVIQTALKIGKDGIEAGTDLVPDSVPRPVARISVAVVAVTVAIFLLKSFLSTAFFVLAMMGFIYFVYIAFNKDGGPRGGGGSASSKPSSDEEAMEEVRRIMEKYK
ncbi:uncharacterized protein A4U43_C01F7090 [Asparagus officinalis]|uniref:Transmembrane protein n=1 Tax=Asparagus officinalis TaxID=4686 RepID=A0A5P1FS73_ASPOF|nr:uncharacterized protein LOC109835582 [Asparagus officinalis]ONK79510.1 uncharacterized protein A4U43_C01F7090 [Asparagus officinalis]